MKFTLENFKEGIQEISNIKAIRFKVIYLESIDWKHLAYYLLKLILFIRIKGKLYMDLQHIFI